VRALRDGRILVAPGPPVGQAAPSAVHVPGAVRVRARAEQRGGPRLRAAERVPGHQQPDVRVLHGGRRPDTRQFPVVRRADGLRYRGPGVPAGVHRDGRTGETCPAGDPGNNNTPRPKANGTIHSTARLVWYVFC